MDEQTVRAHIGRIVESDGFARAPRLCRFLEFTVEATLRGEAGDGLKEYVVGREVFDRDERYDPRLDPIVRVEARRLRSRLEAYYEGAGRAELLRIEYPKGGYSPLIRPAADPAPAPLPPPPVVSRRRWLPAAAAAGLAATALWLWRARPAPPGEIAVIPGRWLRPGATPDDAEDALAETVTMELTRRRALSVAAWPTVLRWRALPATPTTTGIAREARVGAVLVVSARSQAAGDEIVVHLVDGETGRKRWAEAFPPIPLPDAAARRALAARIADGLAAAPRR